MAIKRGTKATKRGKRVKDMRVSGAVAQKVKGGKGGKGKTIEIKDFSFGVENPTTIGSSSGGTSEGSVPSISELKIGK